MRNNFYKVTFLAGCPEEGEDYIMSNYDLKLLNKVYFNHDEKEKSVVSFIFKNEKEEIWVKVLNAFDVGSISEGCKSLVRILEKAGFEKDSVEKISRADKKYVFAIEK